MSGGTEPTLAGGFPEASEQEWRSGVERVLRGAPFDRLVSRTSDDVAVQPLYTDGPDESVTGTPGTAPFTRGFHPTQRPGGRWDVRAPVVHPDPAEANRLAVHDLERGATSLLVRFDAATRAGVAPGEAGYAGAGAVDGVCGTGEAVLDRVLDDVHLDLAPVVLAPGASMLAAAEWLMSVWSARGVADSEALGGFGADPIGTLATTGSLPQGIDRAVADAAGLAAVASKRYPGVRAITVDATPYAEAGASEAQELAALLCTAAAYLRAMAGAGISAGGAAGQLELVLGADADQFTTIAKLRAARRVWSAMADACGIDTSVASPVLTVRTLHRMMSRRDPWVNLLRVTTAGFAAAVGGADGIITGPFDAEVARSREGSVSSELGRRMARNTQLLLAEESGVGRVVDPAGGSWYVETLTEQIAEAAWDLFRVLEGAGGLPAVLLDRTFATRIAQVRHDRVTAVATRRAPITGVSEFPELDGRPVEVTQVDRARLRDSAESDGELVVAGAATSCEPLQAVRWAEPFEALRDDADVAAAADVRPVVFLANLGPAAVHNARAGWARNFFAAGGIDAVTSELGATSGFEDAGGAVADFTSSGARLACICSSDARYADLGESVATALRETGADRVYLAGRPGDLAGALTAAGVDEFVHVGIDVLASLRRAHDALGIGPPPDADPAGRGEHEEATR